MNDQILDNTKTKCLDCHGEITVEKDTQVGEVITCPECSTDLEVVEVNPIKLTLAPVAQEDWGQ